MYCEECTNNVRMLCFHIKFQLELIVRNETIDVVLENLSQTHTNVDLDGRFLCNLLSDGRLLLSLSLW